MKKSFESRLKAMVAEIEESDGRLSEELNVVRSDRAGAQVAELQPQLESLGVGRGTDDLAGLARETIVLRTGRPVLAVVNDEARLDFRDAESEIWRSRLTRARELVGRAIRAVGRIEVDNHEEGMDWVGTGWLVAPDIIVTNRHVAEEFATRSGRGFVFRQGPDGRMSARIDFLEEFGRDANREHRLSSILHIEERDAPDVAFLRVEQTSGNGVSTPIVLSRRDATPRQQVAVIGYPARDGRIPEQDLMLRIFGEVFDKKRLAPGLVKRLESGLLLHDCSTLGGNSGSVVLDLDSGEAVALHFSGRFLEANYAVPSQTVGQILRTVGRSTSAASTGLAPRTETHSLTAFVEAGATSFSIPLSIHIELGTPDHAGAAPTRPPVKAAIVQPARPASVPAVRPVVQGDPPPPEKFEEGRPEDYAEREGYAADFLGTTIGLPAIRDERDVLTFRLAGEKSRELKYEHFTVVMSESRRLCRYSAVNIDGGRSRKIKRSGWRLDPRIAREQQILDECYGNAPRFSRGHMTRREDPIWGATTTARRGNSDSMHVTNAVPQIQPFNAGIWLGLEDYALENAREDDMRIAVITGPVLRDDDPVMFGVKIPVTFWKVIAFIHDETGDPCATGYTMSQRNFLREDEFVFGQHETAQVPISLIEATAGLSFSEELRRLDPLERVAESRPRPLRDIREIRFR